MKKKTYRIAVSGAAEIDHCCNEIRKLAKELGKEIARQKCVLITGATTGVPYLVAKAADPGCTSIGFSPAASQSAHLKSYRLPIDAFDVMVYTGFDYAGRNLLMTRAADAVIIVCGRMGTLNEFTIAFEDQKPIGVLEGTGGTADIIRDLTRFPHRRAKFPIIFDKSPKRLVQRLIKLMDKTKRSKK